MSNATLKMISVLSGLPAVRRKMFAMMFDRHDRLPIEPMPPADPAEAERRTRARAEVDALLAARRVEQLTLTNAQGDRIRARLIPCDAPTGRFALMAHGYRCSGLREFTPMLAWYLAHGVSLLIPDLQAHGDSEGELITFGGLEHLDLLQWTDLLIQRFGPDIRILLHGVSMGAATVMLTAGSRSRPAQVKAAVADCGYTSLEAEVLHCFKTFGIPESSWPTIRSRFEQKTGLCADDISPLQAVVRCEIPLTLIHGAVDDFVPTPMADELHAACPHSTMLKIPGAGHAESWWLGTEAYTEALTEAISHL